jgi:hypothetical protein
VDGQRPLGLTALSGAFAASELDLDALGRFQRPVYFALGGLSNPDHYARIAERLAGVFPDFSIEVFEECHHFDTPQG